MRRDTNSAPAFPEIEAQLGDTPARFLLPTAAELDELSWETRAQAFIRGLDEIETIRAWQRVEVALELGPNGGARKNVITWLNHRQAAIDGRDGPVDDTAHTDASARDETTDPVAEPGTPTPATAKSTTTAVAADGGTPPNETPRCPECHGECTREEIVGKIGFWCPTCGEFRGPVTMEAHT